MNKTLGYDLTAKKEAAAAVEASVLDAARAIRREDDAAAQYGRWGEAVASARAMARLVGCSVAECDEARAAAAREPPALSLVELRDGRPLLDFSTKDASLRALTHAVVRWESAGGAREETRGEREEAVAAMKAIVRLVVRDAGVSQNTVDGLVARVADAERISPEHLSGGLPVAEKPLAELIETTLREAGGELTTSQLLERLSAMGRPVDTKNPWATIRGSIMARSTSPVISAGPGRWTLRIEAPGPSRRGRKPAASRTDTATRKGKK